MRDLQADLKGLTANPAVWAELPRSIIVKYVERAIFAEDCMERRQDACGTWMKKCEELEAKVAALTEAIQDALYHLEHGDTWTTDKLKKAIRKEG